MIPEQPTTYQIDLADLVLKAFLSLRQSGLDLGIDEYKAGLSLIPDGSDRPFAQDLDGLKQALQLIWCSSRSQQGQFEPLWEKAIAAAEAEIPTITESAKPKPAKSQQPPVAKPPNPTELDSLPADTVPTKPATLPALGAAVQPVRSPFTPAEIDRPTDLQSYWPVSRRSMSYAWRYLRRTVAEGPAEIVDVPATVQQTAQQGFYLEPVMRRRGCNRAELLLLIDRNGSMMPLHPFIRQIEETARYESNLPESQVTVCYFHNAPVEAVYTDVFLTQPIGLTDVLGRCDRNTSIIILSDAGAARGYRKLDRIRTTTRFIRQLQRTTAHFAWLNPIPQKRWRGSSAEIIANLVPMFQMDDEGLNEAVDVVRGLNT